MKIDSNPKAEKRNHIFQRIGWLAMSSIIVLALLGYFGFGGPVSKDFVTTENYSISYDRFMRTEKPSYLIFTAHRNIDSIKIRFPEKQFRVKTVLPEKALTSIVSDEVFEFALAAEHSLTLKVVPQTPGNSPISISTGDNTKSIKSFIYP